MRFLRVHSSAPSSQDASTLADGARSTTSSRAGAARADVFADAPDPQQYRARVTAAIAAAARDAKTVTDVMRDMHQMLLLARLEEARQVLLRRVAASNASRADYNGVCALLVKRAAVIQAASFPG